MRRITTLTVLGGCVFLLVAAIAVAKTFRTQTTLVAPPTGSEISGQLSSKNHKCLKGRKVLVDIEPFVASATPRQHPVATTDASGAWHAPATLLDRYDVRVGVEAKTINIRRNTKCRPARAEQSVGEPNPPSTG